MTIEFYRVIHDPHHEIEIGEYVHRERILDAVIQRGYRDGWNDSQFAARQIGKALEELAELGAYFNLPTDIVWSYADCLREVGELARHSSFDTTLNYIHETNRIDSPAEDLIQY